ncbi:PAS domain S-box protein [bacterium]|nr:PAS domain S-box protein [bacterium]
MVNTKIKVLNVEDDEVDQLAFKRLLEEERLPYDCVFVNSISKAKTALESEKFDIVISDYNLGDGTVFDITDLKLKTPIIVVTGAGDEAIAVKLMKAGVYDYLIKDPDRNYLEVMSMVLDKTIIQKNSEEKFIMLSHAIMSITDSVYITDMDDNIIYVNKAFCKTYDYTDEEEMLGQKSHILWEMGSENEEELENKITEVSGNNELWHKRKDGSPFPIFLSRSTILDEYENKVAVVRVVRDITERKQAEEQLRRAHMETERLLSSISSILIGINADYKINRWNSSAEQIFGISADNVVGSPFLNCGIQWDWNEIVDRITQSRELGEPTRCEEIRYTRPNGEEGFLTVTLNPVISHTTMFSGLLLLASEITVRKHLELQLAQAQKLESVGQLAAGIAHEINTPIQYLGDNTSFLFDAFTDLNKLLKKYGEVCHVNKSGTIDSKLIQEVDAVTEEVDLDYLLEEIPTAIEQSQEGVERVSSIVRAMKEFSHPGSAEKTLTDLNKALENTITVARNEWKYVADVVTDFDPSLPFVPCLPGEINQVFLNVIVNAAQAIAAVVKKGPSKKGTITIGTSHENDWAEITIADTGMGIPKKTSSKIFDPFFTTKEVGKGTGQGLAISHNVVVEKHGGSIDCETKLNKGTTFIIRLPTNHQD